MEDYIELKLEEDYREELNDLMMQLNDFKKKFQTQENLFYRKGAYYGFNDENLANMRKICT